jgi:hypothetical protein
MNRFVLSLCVVCATTALAASRAEFVSRAVNDVKEALDEAADAPASCKKKLTARLDALDDAVRSAKKDPTDAAIRQAGRAADRAADTAEEACTGSSGKRLGKALSGVSKTLDDALAAKDEASPPPGPPPVFGAIAQGLGGLFAGAAKANVESTTQTSSSESSRTTRTEQINGQDLEPEPSEPAPAPKKKVERKDGPPSAGEFGATCSRNSQCASNSCFIGNGTLGFCTQICSEDRDCPGKAFEWSCYRPRNLNAPQKLCLQARD